jgi:hypothetical protein
VQLDDAGAQPFGDRRRARRLTRASGDDNLVRAVSAVEFDEVAVLLAAARAGLSYSTGSWKRLAYSVK